MSIKEFFEALASDLPFHHTQPAAPGAGPAPAPGGPPEADDTTVVPMTTGRVLLIHGYSADWKGLLPWQHALQYKGIVTIPIAIGNYVTLNNEVTIKDLGEAFDRALRHTVWSTKTKDDIFTFDAIVHSTGMLVLRQWLTSDPYLDGNDPRSRIRRLKHLVGLAPATFGSPQAQEGRSWLGALIKGDKEPGPDFLNAGNRVLSGLELASSYTWDLAHKDMLRDPPLFDKGDETPYVTVFIGNSGYTGLSALANSPGSDGTVRWAGCALNTRKVTLDFRLQTRLLDDSKRPTRCQISPWADQRLAAPLIAVDGKNHGTLISVPDDRVRDFIIAFLHVSNADQYKDWEAAALEFGKPSLLKMDQESADGPAGGAGWQQIIVHLVDDHGDGISDFNLQLFFADEIGEPDDPGVVRVPLIVDTFSGDSSYRCFYVRLTAEMLALNTAGGPKKKLWFELVASSGSDLIEYEAYNSDPAIEPVPLPERLTIDHHGGSPVKLDITGLAEGDQSLLYPYTTTLLEIFVEREPMPLRDVSKVFTFPVA